MINKVIIDLDDTLCFSKNGDYANAVPNIKPIDKLSDFKKKGYQIIIYTSRNMNTYNDDTNKIKENTYPKIVKWLNEHNVNYDELIIGKPWCGPKGFYVDDKSIRPDEFEKLTCKEI